MKKQGQSVECTHGSVEESVNEAIGAIERVQETERALRGVSDLALSASDLHLVNPDHLSTLLAVLSRKIDRDSDACLQAILGLQRALKVKVA